MMLNLILDDATGRDAVVSRLERKRRAVIVQRTIEHTYTGRRER